jgi:hypothetical protein
MRWHGGDLRPMLPKSLCQAMKCATEIATIVVQIELMHDIKVKR